MSVTLAKVGVLIHLHNFHLFYIAENLMDEPVFTRDKSRAIKYFRPANDFASLKYPSIYCSLNIRFRYGSNAKNSLCSIVHWIKPFKSLKIKTSPSHLSTPHPRVLYLSRIDKLSYYVFHSTYRSSPNWSRHLRPWLWRYFGIELVLNEVHDHMNFPQIWQNHWSFY